jgi:hypothetical protein
MEQIQTLSTQGPVEFTKDRVEQKRKEGKIKFNRGDHNAAKNAFIDGLESLRMVQEQEDGQRCDPIEWKQADLCARYVTLCCNIAVCAAPY